MTIRDARGQSLVELALVLPIVLVMFAGLYAACRTGFLASAAQSAARTEALRSGRALPGIEKQLSADLLPGEAGASVGSDSGKKARVLPAPFPSLAGRSSGVASVRKEWTETGEIGEFGPLHLARRVDLCADCWGGTSRSGKNIRRTVLARIALGALR